MRAQLWGIWVKKKVLSHLTSVYPDLSLHHRTLNAYIPHTVSFPEVVGGVPLTGFLHNLYRWYRALPDYTKHTQRLPDKARELRKALTTAVDPVELILTRFPEALGVEDLASVKDGSKKALDRLVVTSAQRRQWQRTHSERRQERIGAGNLHLATPIIRDVGKAPTNQTKERIGRKMLAAFRCDDRQSNLRHEMIKSFKRSHERGMVAWMFTKGQMGGQRGYWVLLPSGHC